MKETIAIRITHLYEDLNALIPFYQKNKAKVKAARSIVDNALTDGKTYYGINTGFGNLANQKIDADALSKLQRNYLRSHSVGVREPVPRDITRIMLLLRIHSLGQGASGISEQTFDRLLLFASRDLIPVVPSRGSVGASGDLAPLAHLSLPLIGEGEFWNKDGTEKIDAATVLKRENLSPVELQPKDSLSLTNGTQFMAAYGVLVLHQAINLLKVADIIASMSVEGIQGSQKPFDARIQQVRPHEGQKLVAANLRQLLVDSEIMESHRNCKKVQDPYSFRCVPQVHGACRGCLRHATEVVETEINSVTDNPLVFENGDIISGGNFHGEPLALALDYAAMGLSEIASISERRSYFLLTAHDGLPVILADSPGLNSGFMIVQYTAAALVSENKVLSHPASVDSIPTAVGQEDHVSMGSISARKLLEVYENTKHVLAIELLLAAQALDYRKPLHAGKGACQAHEFLRSKIKHVSEDRSYQEDLRICSEMIEDGSLVAAVETKVGPLQ